MTSAFRCLAWAVVSVVSVGFVSATPLLERPPCCAKAGSEASHRTLPFRPERRRRRRDERTGP
jgi:hypothetical protein